MLLIKNATFLSSDFEFEKGDIAVANEKLILAPGGSEDESKYDTVINGLGYNVIPGLIDIHTHGAMGFDVMEASPGEIEKLSYFYARGGVTSFMPTTITSDMGVLFAAAANIRDASQRAGLAASIDGVHIEGPYINPHQKGCHDASYIKKPEITEYIKLRSILGEKLKIRMTVAPEIDGAEEFVKFVCQNGGNISVGHTDADYKTAMGALNAGASSFTHLFNAMRGIHHREAGTAGAALLSGAYTELICDGLHLCPEIICLALRLKGYEKIILVTDSMKATGLNDGIYNFGGLKVNVKGAEARLDDGTLAGSTLRLVDGVRNLEKFTGLPFKKVVMTATLNPARATGIDAFTGSIEPGKRADLVILDDDKNIIYTISSGTIVYQRESS